MNSDTIFTKIINREVPAKIVYETDQVLAFEDISPQAPVHVLIIPKKPVKDMRLASAETLGVLMSAVNDVAKKVGVFEKGFRVVVNTDREGGQTVFHLHLHLLGGKQLGWSPD